MRLTALYYVCSVWIYLYVHRFKNQRSHTNLSMEGNCKTYRKVATTTGGAKYSKSLIKNDNFTVKLSFLFNSENSAIHSFLYNKLEYYLLLDHEYLTNLN